MIDKEYIRGFFDGEGSVNVYRRNGYLQPKWRITNTCLSILQSIKKRLEELSYHPKLHVHGADYEPTHKQIYSLELYRWSEIIRFYHEIGTELPDKRLRFEELIALDGTRPGSPREETIEQLTGVG